MCSYSLLQRIFLTQSKHQRGIKYAPMLLGEIALSLLEKMERELEKKEGKKGVSQTWCEFWPRCKYVRWIRNGWKDEQKHPRALLRLELVHQDHNKVLVIKGVRCLTEMALHSYSYCVQSLAQTTLWEAWPWYKWGTTFQRSAARALGQLYCLHLDLWKAIFLDTMQVIPTLSSWFIRIYILAKEKWVIYMLLFLSLQHT